MRLIFRMHWWQPLEIQLITPEGEYFISTSLPLIYPICASLSVFHNYSKSSKFTHAVKFHPVGCLKFSFSFYPTFLAFLTAPKYNLSPQNKTRITSILLLPIFLSYQYFKFIPHSLIICFSHSPSGTFFQSVASALPMHKFRLFHPPTWMSFLAFLCT